MTRIVFSKRSAHLKWPAETVHWEAVPRVGEVVDLSRPEPPPGGEVRVVLIGRVVEVHWWRDGTCNVELGDL